MNLFGMLVQTAVIPMIMADAIADTYYVDANYLGGVSDGSQGSPWKGIQTAYNNVASGDTIIVRPGVYNENGGMGMAIGKHLSLVGSGPDTTRIESPQGHAFFIDGGWYLLLRGLHISAGRAGGYFVHSANVTVENCVISECGNEGLHARGQTVMTVRNCTISSCLGDGVIGDGYDGGSTVTVIGSIIVSNGGNGLGSAYGHDWSVNPVWYNCIWDNGGSNSSPNGISENPTFVDPATGDYHLRFDSLCINSGHPGSGYVDPDGTRNDMGAYGGPGSAGFFPDPNGGPIVTNLHVNPPVVPQGDTFSITAIGEAR